MPCSNWNYWHVKKRSNRTLCWLISFPPLCISVLRRRKCSTSTNRRDVLVAQPKVQTGLAQVMCKPDSWPWKTKSTSTVCLNLPSSSALRRRILKSLWIFLVQTPNHICPQNSTPWHQPIHPIKSSIAVISYSPHSSGTRTKILSSVSDQSSLSGEVSSSL